MKKDRVFVTAVQANEKWIPPRCAPSVCRTICPYKDLPWHVSLSDMDNMDMTKTYGLKTYVVFGKERTNGCIWGCIVGYTKKHYKEEDIVGHETAFMSRHNMYLMQDCPIEMEHKLHGFCHKKDNGHV